MCKDRIDSLERELEEKYKILGKKIIEITDEKSSEINDLVDEIVMLKQRRSKSIGEEEQ